MIRELRSFIIQNLQINDKLIGTNFDGLGKYVAHYITNNNIPKVSAKGFIQVDAKLTHVRIIS